MVPGRKLTYEDFAAELDRQFHVGEYPLDQLHVEQDALRRKDTAHAMRYTLTAWHGPIEMRMTVDMPQLDFLFRWLTERGFPVVPPVDTRVVTTFTLKRETETAL